MEDHDQARDDSQPESDDDWPLAREGRVFAVGLFWIIPGGMAGALAALPLSLVEVNPFLPVGIGSLVAFVIGCLLEAGHLD